MIEYWYKTVKRNRIKRLDSPKRGCWINVYDIDDNDIKQLIDMGFDDLILEDAKDYYEVPRFEYVDGVNYLFTRFPINNPSLQESSTAVILFAISNEYILTVTHYEPEFLHKIKENQININTTQRVKFLLTALSFIIDDYDKMLKSIRKTLRKYFGDIKKVSDLDLMHIVELEAILNDYISTAIPTNEAFEKMILRKKTLTLHEEDVEILEDFIQDLDQIITSAKNIAKTAENIRSLYEVIISQKLNKIMKTLTALTIVLTVPTIMTGLFGMNTWLPFTNGPTDFLIVIFMTALLSAIVSLWLVKNKWF